MLRRGEGGLVVKDVAQRLHKHLRTPGGAFKSGYRARGIERPWQAGVVDEPVDVAFVQWRKILHLGPEERLVLARAQDRELGPARARGHDSQPEVGAAVELVAGRLEGEQGVVAALRGRRVLGLVDHERYVLEDVPLRDAWERCLAFDGATDERHFARRLREICRQIYAGARAFNLQHRARLALDELMRRRFPAPATVSAVQTTASAHEAVPTIAVASGHTSAGDDPDKALSSTSAPTAGVALPTLDEWIEARCEQFGIDVDFQAYSEWLREYEEEFRSELAAVTAATEAAAHVAIDERSRTALRAEALQELATPILARGALDARPDPGDDDGVMATRGARIDSLNALATLLAVPATIADPVEAWLSQSLAAHLRTVGIVTVANLADFIDLNGFRWHRRVPGLGAVRAARLVAWLSPLMQGLGRPLRAASVKPSRQLALARDQRIASLDPTRLERYGLVPLERLAVPPELDGRRGIFRDQGPNVFDAQDDLTAIKCWLRRYEPTPRTHRAYLHAVEVFYLWSVCLRRKPLSSLMEADIHDFRSFLAAPPADWIQARGVDRASDDWRPLRGALNPASQRHLVTVVGALLSGLVDAGYISVPVVSGVKRQMKLPRPEVHVQRTFSEAQWRSVRAAVAELPNTPSKRRLQLVMELASTSGMRLLEMCTARLGQLRREEVPSLEADGPAQEVWMLGLVGKGGSNARCWCSMT